MYGTGELGAHRRRAEAPAQGGRCLPAAHKLTGAAGHPGERRDPVRRRTGLRRSPERRTRSCGSVSRRNSAVLVLVAAGLILMLSIGTRQGFGLFLHPMCSALGWGRETFSAAIALQNLVWGLAQPFTGIIADRYGAARVTAVGGLLYALGLVMMAYSTTGPALDVSAGLLIGLGLSGASFGVVLGVVGRAVRAGAPHRRARPGRRGRLDRPVRDAALRAAADLAVRLVQRAPRAGGIRVPHRAARRGVRQQGSGRARTAGSSNRSRQPCARRDATRASGSRP